MFDVTPISHRDEYAHHHKVARTLVMIESLGEQTVITEFATEADKVVGQRNISPMDFLNQFSLAQDTDSLLIDSRILLNSNRAIVWQYTPPKTQALYYRYGKHRYAGTWQWNHLIFTKIKATGELYVGVTQHKTRCKLNTRIYHAPLPNVYSSGKICLGNVTLPSNNDIEANAKAYLESTKTHTNNTIFMRDPTYRYQRFSNDLMKRAKARQGFKVSELEVFGTLKDWLNKTATGE